MNTSAESLGYKFWNGKLRVQNSFSHVANVHDECSAFSEPENIKFSMSTSLFTRKQPKEYRMHQYMFCICVLSMLTGNPSPALWHFIWL